MHSQTGDFYKRQVTAQELLVSEGVAEQQVALFVGASYCAFAADSHPAEAKTFQRNVAEQTPGGLNEMI